MTRREALNVKEGEVLDSKYGMFQVHKIAESKINRDIIFYGKNNKGLQAGYPHKVCRRLDNDRTEESNKAD